MNLPIELSTQRLIEEDKVAIIAKCDISSICNDQMARAVLTEVARLIAERYVEENYQKIVEKISQDAIATLSVAEAASKIREALEKQIPGLVVHTKDTEVYQRGILGGLRRVR